MLAESIHGIEVLIRVSELKSFTKAAFELGVSPSAVSNSVTRLEKSLGVRLLHRTTRSLSLTQEGALFVERCRHALCALSEAQNQLSMSLDSLSGSLRVSVPVSMAESGLVELVGEFMSRHPQIKVDLQFDDQVLDLARTGVDVVIRFGEIKDSRLVAKKVGRVRYAVYGSPALFAQYAPPSHPDQLIDYPCITAIQPGSGRPIPWRFQQQGAVWSIEMDSRLSMNNSAALLAAAKAGIGLVRLPCQLAEEAVAQGRLQEVLAPFSVDGSEVSLVYHYQRFNPPKVHAFVEFISAAFARHPLWNPAS